MLWKWPLWALLGLIATPAPARAAQVFGVQVTRQHARFVIGMHLAIDAPPPQVFRALQDYTAMPRYNPDLRAVRVDPASAPGRVRLLTTIHACVLWFCKTVRQEQVMTATANASGGILQEELLPQSGAFDGHGQWTVRPCRSGPSPACVDVEIALTPMFWMPPVIGPFLVRRKMQEEAQRASQGLEQVAQRPASR